MSSPFTTLEAFNSAADGPTEGAIYTFAQAPIFNYIALIASVVLFVWFIVKTYSGHTTSPSTHKSNNSLVPLIIAGLLSLSIAEIKQATHPSNRDHKMSRQPTLTDMRKASNLFPLGLLGMVSSGSLPIRKLAARRKRRQISKYKSLKSLR